MFTGIIECIGIIQDISGRDNFKKISINGDKLTGRIDIGESIAINGVCLTVSRLDGKIFTVDVSHETLKKSNMGSLSNGGIVNLERAVTPNTRLGGHIVSGHVDGTGEILSKDHDGPGYRISIEINEEIARYLIKNGSVAVDGISLTVVAANEGSFDLMIIPTTSSITTITHKKVGDIVNIECDVIGKYVEHFLLKGDARSGGKGNITHKFLSEHGFL